MSTFVSERDLTTTGKGKRDHRGNKGSKRHERDDAADDGVGRGSGVDPHKLRRQVRGLLRNLSVTTTGPATGESA